MVKVFLGNCLINDAVNRVLTSESHNFKRVMVFGLIIFSLFAFGLVTILRHLNPATWFSILNKDVKRIRAAH